MPSVLIRELLDFVDTRFLSDSINDTNMSEQITTLHPMSVFSEFNFLPPMQCYNKYWCDIANLLTSKKTAKQAHNWSQLSLPPLSDNSEIISLDLFQLARFLKHPIEYFFRQRLKIYLPQDVLTSDEENFDLDGLEMWHLKQRVAHDFLKFSETNSKHLSAEGFLPHGPAASSLVSSIEAAQENMLLQLRPYNNQPTETRNISLVLDLGIELNGVVREYYPGQGLMQFTSSKIQGKHFLLLWINHLAMCATRQFSPIETSCLITSDQTLTFSQIEPDQALYQLQGYVDLYQQGLQYPIAIFPTASYAFAKRFSSKGDFDKAINSAYNAWQSNNGGSLGFSANDFEDAYIKLALRDNLKDPLATHSFQANALTLYQLALSCGDFS